MPAELRYTAVHDVHVLEETDRYKQHKCKEHSLSHQLTAQLHNENSKNKKMVITLLQHIVAVFVV